MWDLPDQGLTPYLALAGGLFTTEPPGRPWELILVVKERHGKNLAVKKVRSREVQGWLSASAWTKALLSAVLSRSQIWPSVMTSSLEKMGPFSTRVS